MKPPEEKRATLPASKSRLVVSITGLCMIAILSPMFVPQMAHATSTSKQPRSVPVSMLIDYGNGALDWFNGTVVPSTWNFFNVTVLDTNGELASIFFSSFSSHFVYQINGVGCPTSNPFCPSSWGLWILQGSCWTLATSGVDQILVAHDATVGWYLVPAATLGDATPTGVNCLPVNIDVKPPSDPVVINSGSNGKIPVLILSTQTFNAATQVKASSLTFGEIGIEHSLSFCNNYAQGNQTGLLCFFKTEAANFTPGDTTAILNGQTTDGTPIVGTDSVTVQ